MTDYFAVQLPPEQIRSISSIGLAHIGDAVYELLVRTWLCTGGKATGKGLHRAAVALVCAPRQAELAEKILPLLTQEEQDVFRRGRNANVHSIPAQVSFPFGRSLINMEMSVCRMLLPSSARIFIAVSSVTTYSLPSPAI